MNNRTNKFDELLNRLADARFQKILYIDLTADRFEVLAVNDAEWTMKNQERPSQKISEWFDWFADSPFCHENDRERLKAFTATESLKAALMGADFHTISIVYRRKFNLSDITYKTVSLELVPMESEDGHVTACLFVRDISAEIRNYNTSLEQENDVQNSLPGKRVILIVEDNELNRELLSLILSENYETIEAENGAVGLELLQKHMMKISAVVLDVQMPVMNGYDFLKHVKSDPFLSKIPVIVATGSNNTEEEQICLELGASDFVSKPYNPDIIRSRIANIIRLRESAATMAILQTDERTGLYTLQAFYYHVKQAMIRDPEKTWSVIVFDVDHFKQINENYGEEVGNQVLRQIAEMLKGYIAASDIYGCFGAVRFLLLRENMTRDEIDEWIPDLFAKLKTACSVKSIHLKAGIYHNVDKNLSVPAICDRAITARDSIGRNYVKRFAFYDEEHAKKERRLAAMEAGMKEAYDHDQFSVYYQPKHDVQTGKLMGAEALIRWIHPEFGFLSPGEFIPLFERNGFITHADYYVLKRTCQNLRKWMNEGIRPVPVSVNSSRRDFDTEHYVDACMQPLLDNDIDPSLIHIEVTESMFTDKLDEISRILKECREKGFEIELDDFGSGYSSLTTLATLPLDVMKLDMSFMKDFENKKTQKTLSTCISLAKSLGLRTVSEGVEKEEQVAVLKEYGCDLIQGYYFSKPVPEDQFREYLIKYQDMN